MREELVRIHARTNWHLCISYETAVLQVCDYS